MRVWCIACEASDDVPTGTEAPTGWLALRTSDGWRYLCAACHLQALNDFIVPRVTQRNRTLH